MNCRLMRPRDTSNGTLNRYIDYRNRPERPVAGGGARPHGRGAAAAARGEIYRQTVMGGGMSLSFEDEGRPQKRGH